MKHYIAMAACLLAGNLFAAQQDENLCPPLSWIISATFTKTYPPVTDNPAEKTVWGFSTDSFNYDNSTWTVDYLIDLPDAKDEQQAKQLATAIYQNKIKFAKPILTVINEYKLCQYAFVERHYAVIATSPPLEPQ